MGTTIIRKILSALPTILGISFVAFSLIRLVPGDPVLLLLGERGGDPAVYLKMQKALGLDKHFLIQYFEYMLGVFQGDFGISIVSKRPVWTEFWGRFPATLELGLTAMFFAIIIGIPLGILAAIKRSTFFDYFLMGGSLIGYSMPIFWWGLILILVFSVTLGITPVSGRINILYEIPTLTGLYLIDTLQPSVISQEGFNPFISAVRHLALPSLAMGTIPLALIARMTRSSMLEVLHEDYIRTAKAKGLNQFQVIAKHALKNALIPIVTVIGLIFGSVITGAILTETIFSWPGIGKWIVASINARDYPVIQGGILFIATMVISINVAVDIIYTFINPKLKG